MLKHNELFFLLTLTVLSFLLLKEAIVKHNIRQLRDKVVLIDITRSSCVKDKCVLTGKYFGTGTIVSKDGYIITNRHVALNAKKLAITDSLGKKYLARTIYISKDIDLALIKINPTYGLKYFRINKKIKYSIGDDIYCVGNPLGINFSMSKGIVSSESVRFKGKVGSIDLSKSDNVVVDCGDTFGGSGGAVTNSNGDFIALFYAAYSNSVFGISLNKEQFKEKIQDLINKDRGEGKTTFTQHLRGII